MYWYKEGFQRHLEMLNRETSMLHVESQDGVLTTPANAAAEERPQGLVLPMEEASLATTSNIIWTLIWVELYWAHACAFVTDDVEA